MAFLSVCATWWVYKSLSNVATERVHFGGDIMGFDGTPRPSRRKSVCPWLPPCSTLHYRGLEPRTKASSWWKASMLTTTPIVLWGLLDEDLTRWRAHECPTSSPYQWNYQSKKDTLSLWHTWFPMRSSVFPALCYSYVWLILPYSTQPVWVDVSVYSTHA